MGHKKFRIKETNNIHDYKERILNKHKKRNNKKFLQLNKKLQKRGKNIFG